MERKGSKNTKVFKTKSLKKRVKKNLEDGKTQVVSSKEVNSKASKEKKRKKRKKIIKIIFFVLLALFIICTGVVIGVVTGVIDKTDSLDLEDLKLYKETSFVYDKDGNQIGAFFDLENRVTVEYDDIPEHVVDAVISIEDERFFKHNGVDIKRTAGAIFTYVTNGGKSSFGGSTITQQLVKNIKNDKEATWTRKIREWYRAIVLESKLSKEEIFESYVNQIYMGDGCYGFEVASRNYFGKSLGEVNIAEAAVLGAIIQSPESTNPYRSEEAKQRLLDRQKVVLNQMLKLEKITQEEYDEALNYEIVFKKEDKASQATSSTGAQYTYYVEAVREAVIEDLMETLGVERGIAITKLYGDGYKIYTPFDPNVQSVIDNAYNNSKLFYTDSKGDFMQSAMVVIEQSTGCVLGLIGGADEKTADLVVNRATQLPRQPGSCMKPLGAYGPAFELGLSSPGAGLDDCELTEGNWHPGNYYGYFNGYVTARNAVAQSMNLPAARANLKVDIDYAYNFAKNTGLKSLVAADKVPAALSLGGLTNGVTVMEMANAYATIANGGVYIEPRLYTKVIDSKGEDVIVNNINSKRVMKESTAYMLTTCLQETIRTGTAAGYVRLSNMDIAGKTGNTNGDVDQWFCGYTPYYTIACWNGYDKVGNKAATKAIGYRKIGSYPYTSVSLFNTVVNGISKGLDTKRFEVPNTVTKAELCKVSGLVATDACKNDPRGNLVGSDYIAKDSIPTKTCNIHKTVKICKDTGKIATEYCPNTEEKSFITRDYTPNIKPSDWGYMAPTENCNVHTSKQIIEDEKNEEDEESEGVHIYTDKTTVTNKKKE